MTYEHGVRFKVQGQREKVTFFVYNVKLYQKKLLTMILCKVCDLLFYHFILLSPSCQALSFVLFLHFKVQVWLLHFKLGDCYMSFLIVVEVSTIIVVIQTSSIVVTFKLQSMMYFEICQHMHINFSFLFYFLMLLLFS